ncbi:MAG: DNA repair protein RecN [Holophagales bacterium]|nr:DNA repair protein RecN [Holophagales bacterium]
MLRSLHVRNLAVLAGGDVELGRGFNVLTGETGAGKSLVVDSLALLAGQRASSELVREGAESLSVAGVFDLPEGARARLAEAGLEAEGDELVIRREIGREGRNRVFVNDQPTTLRLLQELAPDLLRIHGQRDELGLLDAELQRVWLDRSGGAEGERLLSATAGAWEAWREIAERLERLAGDERLRAERIELLRFHAREIDEARLAPGEEEELRRDRDAVRHREAIVAALGGAEAGLFEDEGSASERVAAATEALAAVAAWEPLADRALGELDEIRTRLEELGRDLAERLSDLETEPGRLDELEARLALVERLFRKHGASSHEVLARRAAIARELEELESGEAGREALERLAGAALERFRVAALELSAARARWGELLAERLRDEISDLGLAKARLEVALEREAEGGSPLSVDGRRIAFGRHGLDRVTFLFQPNPGEPLLALSKVASGGELARLSLALQLAARGEEAGGSATLVFDEADAGLGGAEGAALGRKLRRLARSGQILAVTHLPQVASFAELQHRVAKRVRQGRTFAEVIRLEGDERIAEVARMLAGERVTPTSRRHATELLAEGSAG